MKVSEVIKAGSEFFANLNTVRDGELVSYEELVFNMDDFFTKLEDNYCWTWERIPVGAKKIIFLIAAYFFRIAVFLIPRTTIRV